VITNEAYADTTKQFGMWVFLSMEGLFFGAIFFLYSAERFFFPEVFALGSHHLVTALASWNTAVLLTSSLTMALAVHFARELTIPSDESRGKKTLVVLFLITTALLGMTFIILKGIEYSIDYREALVPGLNFAPKFAAPKELVLFFSLYFLATAIHALHLLIGVGWVFTVTFGVIRNPKEKAWGLRTDILGLYWHFVDIVWIFLFPLFYLIGGSQ
jgi:cytochrome c oxidase subunit III